MMVGLAPSNSSPCLNPFVTVPNISTWASSVQAVVTAIRQAGATSQMILLPGNDWTSAAAYISDGSAAALTKVTNPDGKSLQMLN
jgi:endoglucanase